MKQDPLHRNKGGEEDCSPNPGTSSVSQHSLGFLHGFVFCLVVKNICKENTWKCVGRFDKSVDLITASQSVCASDHSSADGANVKEETPDEETAEPERYSGQDNNPCNSTIKSSQEFTPNLTGDENVSGDERGSPFPSFYIPLTGSRLQNDRDHGKQLREASDRPPKDLPDVQDNSTTVSGKGRLRKRKSSNVQKVKDPTVKRRPAGEPDKAQDLKPKVVQKSKVAQKSPKLRLSQKLEIIKAKNLQIFSENPHLGLLTKPQTNSQENPTSGTSVKVDSESAAEKDDVPVAPKEFPCDKCDRIFTNSKSFKIHKIRKHRGNENSEKNKGPQQRFVAQCDQCSKVYTGDGAKKNLRRHMLSYHSEVNPVQCDVCNIVLNNEYHLKQHKRGGHRKDVCYICGAHFVSQKGLQGHLLAHRGIKSYICEICGAAFVRISSLRQHARFHSDNRDYKCGRCPGSFKTFSTLSIHMMCVHQCGSYFSNQVQKLAKLGYMIDRESLERLQNSQCVSCGQDLEGFACPIHSSDCLLSFSCSQCQWTTKDIQRFRKHLMNRNSSTMCSGPEETKTMKSPCGSTSKK